MAENGWQMAECTLPLLRFARRTSLQVTTSADATTTATTRPKIEVSPLAAAVEVPLPAVRNVRPFCPNGARALADDTDR